MITLPIKKKWLDMIASGDKTEEYRELNDYYAVRFMNALGLTELKENKDDIWKALIIEGFEDDCRANYWQANVLDVTFRNGYSKSSPAITAECGLSIGYGKPEWGAEPDKEYFILHIYEKAAK